MTEENISESLPTQEIAPAPVPEPIVEAVVEPAPQAIAETAPAPEPQASEPVEEEPAESFADLLRDFERSHTHKSEPGAKQLQGTVISLSAEQVFLDIGYKTEGVLPAPLSKTTPRASNPATRSLSP